MKMMHCIIESSMLHDSSTLFRLLLPTLPINWADQEAGMSENFMQHQEA